MASSTLLSSQPFSPDHEVWENLKQVISTSSGFIRWQREQQLDDSLPNDQLDVQVRRYLRETLETLAY